MVQIIEGSTSIIAGHLTEAFVNSDGVLTDPQLGDYLLNMKAGDTSATAVISFLAEDNCIKDLWRISFANLRTVAIGLAAVIKEKLTPLMQSRGSVFDSEEAQGKTFIALYINAGINRVFFQVFYFF